ncbi:hypothetical protein IMZ48_06035 [Candidatus Bathyarchaeota archaeon]|nr:hypothetical protein [Candidatus Bathyarchaeota archaeon]
MSNNSGNNSAKPPGGSSGSAATEKFPGGPKTTRYAMAQGWGDRRNFQLSMGLKRTSPIPFALGTRSAKRRQSIPIALKRGTASWTCS